MPVATSSAAITPTDFCASLAPWPKASAADVAQLAAAHRPAPAPRPRRRRAAQAADRQQAGERAEQRGERERDQRPEDPTDATRRGRPS